MNYQKIAEQIFLAGIDGVLPDKLIRDHLRVVGDELMLGRRRYSLKSLANIYVIGAGKASALMALEVENLLGWRISGGEVIVKYGHGCALQSVRVTEANHPVPDVNGFAATARIMRLAQSATRSDLIICLLSGGGSALLTDFPEGSSPDEMIRLNDILVKCGARIEEINAVRKHLSKVKGGGLARAADPAALTSLVLSDVPGDSLDVIASGPTTSDPTTYQDALALLDRYHLVSSVPGNLLQHLQEGAAGIRPETPKAGDPVFIRTQNLIIGSNRHALAAAQKKAIGLGLDCLIYDDELQGDVSVVAERLVQTALQTRKTRRVRKPVCLLFGGETTVRVTGDGLGGRNQHLALLTAQLLQHHPGITVLCAGTDGTDGPTDAAGAVVNSETVACALDRAMDPAAYLQSFNAYCFFHKAGGHILTGPTRTNVMDIVVIIIE